MTKHTQVTVVKGRDSFGPWTMAVTDDPEKYHPCGCCQKPTSSVLAYYQCKLPMDMRVSQTILKNTRRPIGVACGCYAKFHRQVVHIAESLLHKGLPV